MHSNLSTTTTAAFLALLVIGTVAQDPTNLRTVSPTGCIKSARCQTPCPAQETTEVTYTSRTTATTTKTSTKTKTITATPTVKPCSLREAGVVHRSLHLPGPELLYPRRILKCYVSSTSPRVNSTFASPPNDSDSPTLQTLPRATQYPTSACVELAMQDSYSANFTIDGTDGTNATTADCRVVLYAGAGCTGVADSYNTNKGNLCQKIPLEDDPCKSAQFELIE